MPDTAKAGKGQLVLANLRRETRLAGPESFKQNPSDTHKVRSENETLVKNPQLSLSLSRLDEFKQETAQ